MGTFYIILACLCWALDTLWRYPLVQAGLSGLSLVFIEHLFLVICFAPFFIKDFSKIFSTTLTNILSFLVIGAAGSAFATIAFTKAFYFLNPSVVILLQKLQPLVAVSLAFLILKEQITKQFLLWAALALLGAILVCSNDLKDIFTHAGSGASQGYILALFSVLGWGAATVFGKKLLIAGYSESQVLFGRYFTAFLALLPFSLREELYHGYEQKHLISIGVIVVVSAMVGMYFYYRGLKSISARTGAIAELFFPFAAVIVNWLFLGQTLTLIQLLGAILLIASSTVIQLKKY